MHIMYNILSGGAENSIVLSLNNTKWLHTWWRHQMETFSALLAICAGNSPVPGEFPTQRPVTRSFDVYFDLRLNKGLSKQSWGWWFETLSRPLWRQCNDMMTLWHGHALPITVPMCVRGTPANTKGKEWWALMFPLKPEKNSWINSPNTGKLKYIDTHLTSQ